MHLIDVTTAYLYGSLDNDSFIKIPEGLKMPEIYKDFGENCSINLKIFIWIELKEGYKNDPIYPCVFMKRSGSEFVIIVVCVDDLDIIRTREELSKAVEYLKKNWNERPWKDKILSWSTNWAFY